MFKRKIVLLASVLALLVTSSVAFAIGDPSARGCYIHTATTLGGTQIFTVNEGTDFYATVNCTLIPDNVFGFEFATGFSSLNDFATVAATSYTPGTFVTGASGGVNIGQNLRSGVYAVTRNGTNTATGEFTLGSFLVTVPFGLVADNNATITLPSGTFKLSDNTGTPIVGDLQAAPEIAVTLTNLAVALVDGNIRVQSDGAMINLSDISVNMTTLVEGTSPTTVPTQLGKFHDFSVAGLVFNSLIVTTSVTMESHLSCSVTQTLADGPNAATTIGTSGTITLYAGDVVTASDHAIDIDDASAIGAAFRTSTTAAVDINGDGLVDIFDLVQLGRNYNKTTSICA